MSQGTFEEERPVNQREREVLRYLVSRADESVVPALLRQVESARVLQGPGPCCATVHIYSDVWSEGVTGQGFAIEAPWTQKPLRSVRLRIAGGGPLQLSLLELRHEDEDIAPMEFPAPEQLGPPKVGPL